MLDLRKYAGKLLLLGQLESSYQARGFELQHCYLLGTIEGDQDLPAGVKAIIEDLEEEAPEASEILWALQVNDQGTAGQRFPIVVFDDQEQVRYGREFLTAVVETGVGAQACVVRGVRFE
jgi:hypothetical protein